MIGYIEEGKSMGKAVIFDLDGTLIDSQKLVFVIDSKTADLLLLVIH